jgi:glycosyltransferase involved in cell wall biosynthesis
MSKKPVVHAYFLCYNEENILPHLIKHYSNFCEKITIIDNKSTDNSVEIVKSFPNTEVLTFESNNSFHDGVHIDVKNNVWKSSIGVADYVILGDTDEFLYHENMIEFLITSFNNGITIFKPEGHHMVGDEDLNLLPNDNILEKVKYGVRTEVLDKMMMFNCNKIKEINYNFGCHNASPLGEVKLSTDNSLKMLHFKFMGLKDYLYKNKIRGERLSDFNKKYGFGTYYLFTEEECTNDYLGNYLKNRKQILK